MNIKKCDFCTKSDENGNCFFISQGARERDCEKAIERMTKAIKGATNKKKYRRRKIHDRTTI